MRKRRETLKDTEQEVRVFRNRSLLAALVVVLMTGGLVARLVYLQVVQHDIYITRSDKNRVRVEPLPPTRGLLLDRNGMLLAENRPTYNLTIVPERVGDLQETLRLLVDILELPEDQVAVFMERSRQRQRPFQPALLMSELNEKQIAQLAINRFRLPGIEVEAQLLRYYPDTDIMSHVVGYVGRINAEELANLDKGDYAGTHFIGKTGVEKEYEDVLHGEAGLRKVETNARGRVLRELGRTDPAPGKDIVLSIDKRLQKLAYQLLDGRRGSIVAIEPKTGEILAMVSSPGFNSNLFVTGISYEDYRRLQNDPDLPLYNRSIRGQYPPASTVKPYVALAGLENGVITPSKTIYDPGYYKLPGFDRRYHNWLRWGHGRVDMQRAIVVSNDTYFYTLAHDLGIDRLADFMHRFGFGEETSYDVYGAASGLMPSSEWKRERHGQVWFPGETLSVGIGQGYWLATPLQMATAMSVLANRGEWVTPHLAKRIDGKTVTPPKLKQDIELSNEQWWELVDDALEDVMTGSEGTARRSGQDLAYRMAGKSGTAQVFTLSNDERYNAAELEERLHDHALFTAFAPIEDPQIALAVIIENAGGGSTHAAPLARQLLDAWLLPDDESLEAAAEATEEHEIHEAE
ncbi:penicillin-binding protein 2 [Halomonas sp. McH1-25]|uniref:penicillin-binding protein 2 n=1 Tax=unclassified Halomonas TaxID=2609666 RepID=UPI001EF73C1B|nr:MULTISPECIES: penicillin-binding protein 2 [unclassified Halomonas]MCG7599104.1 penicillin-binding protein 2 [Halomonas sp. McH1-25]MCP1342339.1 penicillin-binding protein 2 [Halomonas sp. FL8]MCP1360407.1 penicillin-binding protein 2 [Halomonas sp. BBD45]